MLCDLELLKLVKDMGKTVLVYVHSQKRIMKPFAFTKSHDFRVFT